jgi:hypothetical protein
MMPADEAGKMEMLVRQYHKVLGYDQGKDIAEHCRLRLEAERRYKERDLGLGSGHSCMLRQQQQY